MPSDCPYCGKPHFNFGDDEEGVEMWINEPNSAKAGRTHADAASSMMPPSRTGLRCCMRISDEERREAVEFLRSGTCLYFAEHRKRQLDCTRCMKVSTMLFGHYDALCDLDSCGTDAWQRLADLIDRTSENIERPR